MLFAYTRCDLCPAMTFSAKHVGSPYAIDLIDLTLRRGCWSGLVDFPKAMFQTMRRHDLDDTRYPLFGLNTGQADACWATCNAFQTSFMREVSRWAAWAELCFLASFASTLIRQFVLGFRLFGVVLGLEYYYDPVVVCRLVDTPGLLFP